jgi:uncharacterized lipoprotein YmbA
MKKLIWIVLALVLGGCASETINSSRSPLEKQQEAFLRRPGV